MADKLKPCPFCGGVAQVNGPIGGTFSIYQQHSLDCPVGGGERNYETEAEAIAAWNTRIEALEAALDKLLISLAPLAARESVLPGFQAARQHAIALLVGEQGNG